MQAHEHLGDGRRQPLVHGETIARPVHRVAEPAHLPADRVAGLLLPLPDALYELLAADVLALATLGVELAFHHHLRGNAGVIRAGLPQRAVAAHAVIPGQRVHQRVLERMAHVQGAGDVGRRDHDAVGADQRPTARSSRCAPSARKCAARWRPDGRSCPWLSWLLPPYLRRLRVSKCSLQHVLDEVGQFACAAGR